MDSYEWQKTSAALLKKMGAVIVYSFHASRIGKWKAAFEKAYPWAIDLRGFDISSNRTDWRRLDS